MNILNNWNNPSDEARLNLVFETRNKLYGAYEIRKKFSKYMLLALIFASSFAVLLTGSTLLYTKYVAGKKEKKGPKIITTIETLDEIEEEEEEVKEEVKVKEPEPEVEQAAYVAPKIDNSAKVADLDLFDPSKIDNPSDKTLKGIKDPFSQFTMEEIKTGPIKTGDGKGKIVNVQNKASYPGGEEAFANFIRTNFVYPTRCQTEGINGSVTLKFVVDVDGSVSDVRMVDETKSCTEFTAEAIRVIKLTNWTPGNTNGKFFKSYRTLPIALNVSDE